MSQLQVPNRCIFIGNVPFDMPEEDIKKMFEKVGPIVSFRMMYDKETKKSKGFGFIEYPDIQIAKSAVRNLNNFEINGRKIRVAYADNDASRRSGEEESNVNINTTELIRVINSMDELYLHEKLLQLKEFAERKPEALAEMLNGNKELSYALMYCFLKLELLKEEELHDLIRKTLGITEEQEQFVIKLLNTSQESIDALPEEYRERVIRIREQFLG